MIVLRGETVPYSDRCLLHTKELPHYLWRNRKRTEYLSGRYALKSLLSRELGVEYADLCILNERYGEQSGKPRLYINDAPADYSVSISHDAGIIFACFADHDIGADVAAERGNAGAGRACLDWAIGEAFTKALGIGLKYGIPSVKTDSMDREKGMVELEVSEKVLSCAGRYSDISFTYEMREQAVFVICELIG